MCMEDVILGRKTATQEHLIALTNASQPIVDFDKNRVLLTFFPPPSGVTTFSLRSPVVNNKGIVLPSTGFPVVLDIREAGDMVCKQWYAIHSVGGVTMVYYEGHLHGG